MRNFFTIGELAKLFDIKTTKIRFYERKGLLSPKNISESGYRLYSFSDLENLEVILLLREMGVSIERIRELNKGYKTEDYKTLLLDLKKDTYNQIKRLKRKINLLEDRIDHLRKFNVNEIKIAEYPDRYCTLLEENLSEFETEKEFFDKHNKYNLKISNYDDQYVFIINSQNLCKGIISKNPSLSKLRKIKIPKGKYLILKRSTSLFKEFSSNKKNLINELKSKGYEVEGPLYGIEDFRLFLFSNQTEYYNYEIKLKEKKSSN